VALASGGSLPADLWRHFRRFTVLSLLITAEFIVVYYGADWLTAHRTLRIHVYTAAELGIPLVPVMVVPYMTMYVIFLFAPFVLRSRVDLDRFAHALALVIVTAGVAFLLLPAEPGFAPVSAAGSIWDPWLRLATTLSRRYDLVPSLHVALFTVAAGTYATRVSTRARAFLGVWLVVVAASTVLTHQHHLVDVVAGLILGAWGARVSAGGSVAPVAQRRNPAVLRHEGSGCSP
jgi:membrane-associated phospholipid phosphatase